MQKINLIAESYPIVKKVHYDYNYNKDIHPAWTLLHDGMQTRLKYKILNIPVALKNNVCVGI